MNDRFLEDYQVIHEPFMNYCRGKSWGIMDTQDLMQETILQTLIRYNEIRQKEHLLNYMVGTARNIISNHQRKKKEVTLREEWMASIEEVSPALKMDLQHLYYLIQQLDSIDQDILILFEFNGYKHKEIAALLDMNINSVKTRLRRTRIKLKAEYNEHTLRPMQFAEALSMLLFIYLQTN